MGPQRADLLKKELNVFTFKDLLELVPYRHIDKTKVNLVRDITPQTDFIQIAGRITSMGIMGEKRAKRLVAELRDSTGIIELVWFQGINWIQKSLTIGQTYLVYGKVSFFQGTPQITHPELETFSREKLEGKSTLEPVYPSTEKLKSRGMGGRQIGHFTETLIKLLQENNIPEILPETVVHHHARFIGKNRLS